MDRWTMQLLALMFLGFASPAYADKVTLTVLSDPAGATVYVNTAGDHIGYAPVVLTYSFAKHFFKQGRCVTVEPIRVRWASGAEAVIESLTICGTLGKKQQVVFVRPTEVPGRDIDVQFAIAIAQLGASRAASAQTEILALAAYAHSLYAQGPRFCTSRLIGRQVFTTCN